jgi:hypothetical protein
MDEAMPAGAAAVSSDDEGAAAGGGAAHRAHTGNGGARASRPAVARGKRGGGDASGLSAVDITTPLREVSDPTHAQYTYLDSAQCNMYSKQ